MTWCIRWGNGYNMEVKKKILEYKHYYNMIPIDVLEKQKSAWKKITNNYESGSCSAVSTLWLHGLHSPWNSPGQNTGVGSSSLLQGTLASSGIEPRSPALQVDSLPDEPQAKPKNTGVGSLSVLQWTFPTQELNRGLLHCRRILYQLSYQGSQHNYNNT